MNSGEYMFLWIGFGLGFILALIILIICDIFKAKRVKQLKVGDIVYLKPTYQKCIIHRVDRGGEYYLTNMNGYVINVIRPYHRNMLTEEP